MKTSNTHLIKFDHKSPVLPSRASVTRLHTNPVIELPNQRQLHDVMYRCLTPEAEEKNNVLYLSLSDKKNILIKFDPYSVKNDKQMI
jgi:hypothetical protein